MRSGSSDGIPEARAVQDAQEYTPPNCATWAVAGPVKCMLSLRVRAASSAGRALRSQCRGRGFDPPAVHQPSLTSAHANGQRRSREEAAKTGHSVKEWASARQDHEEAALAASLRVRTSRPRQTSADGFVSARQDSDSCCGHARGAQAALHRCVRVMFSRRCCASHTLTCGRACWHVTCIA